jgi:hypothetical protein
MGSNKKLKSKESRSSKEEPRYTTFTLFNYFNYCLFIVAELKSNTVQSDSSDDSSAGSDLEDNERPLDEEDRPSSYNKRTKFTTTQRTSKKSHADSRNQALEAEKQRNRDYWMGLDNQKRWSQSEPSDPLKAVGRQITKEFYDQDIGDYRIFQGIVTEWNGEDLYHVEYFDGDKEDMSVEELDFVISNMN